MVRRIDSDGSIVEAAITVDAELASLVPPLAPDEFAQLEANLVAEGCRDALVVWPRDGELVLVDGHNRLQICQAHDLPARIVERPFDTRADVQVWMLRNQLGRRNLPEYLRVKLALRLKPALEAQAIERMNTGNPVPKSAQGRTRDTLAKEAGVGHSKFAQIEYVYRCAPGYIQAAYERESITANHAYELTRALEQAHNRTRALMTTHGNTQRDLVPILNRLAKNKSDTLAELEASGYLQFGDEDEAVPLAEMTALQLQQYADFKAKEYRQRAKDAKRDEAAARGREVTVQAVDFRRADFRGVHLAPNSVDLIFTDPPYDEESLSLWDDLSLYASHILKPSGLLVAYTGHAFLPRAMSALGTWLDYHWTIATVYAKGDLRFWSKRVWNSWKPLLVYANGQPDTDWFCDLLTADGADDKALHDWQQPLHEAAQVIERFTKPGDLVLDPMCGAGTIPIAAAQLGRRAVGIEVDERTFYIAKDRANQLLHDEVRHDAAAAD